MHRPGTSHEIANAILFAADNEKASYMTGSVIVVDGGYLVGRPADVTLELAESS